MTKENLEKIKNRIVGYGEESLDQIQFNPRNWRVHPLNQQNALKGVLDEVGYVQSVIVNKRTGNLIDGHLRCQLSAREGNKTIPVVYVDLSEEEEALVLATIDPIGAMAVTDKQKLDELFRDIQSDNEDVQKLIAEIAEKERLEYGKQEIDAEPQIDRAAELNEKWQVKTGDLWQIGEHRLLCGDSTKREDVERVMGGEKAMACISDPPYNVAYSSRGSNKDNWGKIENDEMTEDDFNKWLISAGAMIDLALAGGASIYLCHGDTDRKSIPFIDLFQKFNWKRSATIIWAKQAASMGWQDYRSQHECVSYGWKQGAEHYFTDDRSQTTLWEIDRDAQANYSHPTQKPVELFQRAIENSTIQESIVFDPFIGSGTTMVACQNLSRKCRAIEISPNYCAVILERMHTAFPELEIKRL